MAKRWKEPKRWYQLNWALFLGVVMIAIFGLVDSIQIRAPQITNTWGEYEMYVAPMFIALWYLILLTIAGVYYLFTKDFSEALGVFLAPAIMLAMGLEDLFFFLFSPEVMPSCMNWFHLPISTVSHIMGEMCVSPFALYANAAIGFVLGISVFFALRLYKIRR